MAAPNAPTAQAAQAFEAAARLEPDNANIQNWWGTALVHNGYDELAAPVPAPLGLSYCAAQEGGHAHTVFHIHFLIHIHIHFSELFTIFFNTGLFLCVCMIIVSAIACSYSAPPLPSIVWSHRCLTRQRRWSNTSTSTTSSSTGCCTLWGQNSTRRPTSPPQPCSTIDARLSEPPVIAPV